MDRLGVVELMRTGDGKVAEAVAVRQFRPARQLTHSHQGDNCSGLMFVSVALY
ncbi:hypothetical protein [Streptomyces sp. NPDC012756]|uniref:hypothetical protein n=1 Tax=Streptomyces sp. NPDC012756 TaxID=3364847 RepID=UPI00369D7EFE